MSSITLTRIIHSVMSKGLELLSHTHIKKYYLINLVFEYNCLQDIT